MWSKSQRLSFATILCSEFFNYMGVAIVYPLFAYILFEPTLSFLSADTTNSLRGLWLGVLIALHPLLQFLSSPILGCLSDIQGRKKLLLYSMAVGLVGYALAYLACIYESLLLLAAYRICSGLAAGNCAIVSAIVADLSTAEKKAKNYGLLNMAFGAGFTIGPFLSGTLAYYFNLATPFLIAFFLVAVNWVLVVWKLKETHARPSSATKIPFFGAVAQLKKACGMRELRPIFLVLLIFSLGWSFFTEFISIFLMDRYAFTPDTIGFYYGYTGFFYALSAGFLIYPLMKWVKMERTLFLSMAFSGVYIWAFAAIYRPTTLWIYLPLSQFFLSFVYPALCAVISNQVSEERQGEAMGIYQAIIALALTITPFTCGPLIGNHPTWIIFISGALMACAAILYYVSLARRKLSVVPAQYISHEPVEK